MSIKLWATGLVLALAGCQAMPFPEERPTTQLSCTQDCEARFAQCPQLFAGYPGRGDVECPASHRDCLKTCEAAQALAQRGRVLPWMADPPPAAAPPPPVPSPPTPGAAPHPQPAVAPTLPAPDAHAAREAALRELKQFHDEGLVSDDVYVERQRAILEGR